MNNAKEKACEVLFYPDDPKYDENIRNFQGCPTIAVTKNGRIFAGWYSGGIKEPDMDNYNLLVMSDDNGQTWSKPILIIPSNKELFVHALDIQLWMDSDGKLHVFWVQNNTTLRSECKTVRDGDQPLTSNGDYTFDDFVHAEWEIVCDDPDADEMKFSEPRYLFQGFMRCKPTVLKNGDILYFAYDQIVKKYSYSISTDNGETFSHHIGPDKINTCFDEGMAYQLSDGTVRLLARSYLGALTELYSKDNGRTWTAAKLSNIISADTRFYVSWTPSGRLLMVVNDDPKSRTNLTVMLSEDEGVTWKYKKLIDNRRDLSYPDVDFNGDNIYLVYDRERTGAKEILFAKFTEQDIIENNDINISIISKP